MSFMCGSMVRSGSSLTPRFRIEQFEQFIESRKHRTQIMGMRDIVQLYTMVQQIMYA